MSEEDRDNLIEEDEEEIENGSREPTTYEVLDKIFSAVEEGYYSSVKFYKGTLYLYNDSSDSRKFDLSMFDKKQQLAIKNRVLAYAKKVRKKARRSRSTSVEPEKEKRHGKKESTVQAGVGRRVTLEELDRSHAKIVKHITERVGWFADVLNEVGFYATLIAMQYAKVPINEIYDRIVDFSDPYEFVDFVRTNLNALFEAKEEARAIVELRKKIDALELKAIALEEIINELRNQRDQATLALYAAVSTMDEDQLRQFIMNLMVAQFGLGVKMPNIYNMNVGGVSGGTGGVVSEGNSEEEGDTTGAGTTAS